MMQQVQVLTELADSGRFVGPLRMQPLQGGAVNHSYVLKAGKLRYFLKQFDGAHLSESRRRANHLLQQQLAAAELAPKPLYLGKNCLFQVEQWVECVSLAEADFSQEAKMHRLTRGLYRIHQLSVKADVLDLPADWSAYLKLAHIQPDADLEERLDAAEQRWRASMKQERVFCHHDLAMQHLSATSDMVFDWEYAALGSRAFDLAACIEVNKLDEAATDALLHFYAELSDIPSNRLEAQVHAMHEVISVTNLLWDAVAAIK